MTQALATRDPAALMERAVIQGDLSDLSPAERVEYYTQLCRSLKLNPYSKPFAYLELAGEGGTKQLQLYARRDCTDQLRTVHHVSITRLEKEWSSGLYIVTAYATTPDGRTDSATGAVPIAKEGGYWEDITDPQGKVVIGSNGKPRRRFVADGTYQTLTGEALANAIMKAESKAKRRVTLSICGLGFTDESEIDSIPGAVRVEGDYPQTDVAEMVTSADHRVWKRWTAVKSEAEGLGVPDVPELTLPMPLEELKATGQRVLDGIEARKQQLAHDDAERAEGKAAHDRRAELWAENRRLVEEARTRNIQGRTISVMSGEDMIAEANAELAERIRNFDLDQQAQRASERPML